MKPGSTQFSYLPRTYYSLPTTISVVLHDTLAPKPTPPAASIEELTPAPSRLHHLRDGEVVLYKVARSTYWQARFHLFNGRWIRFSTRKRNLEDAKRIACDKYDEARFRERMGFAPVAKRFDEMAKTCIAEMRRDLEAGTGKKIYTAYIAAIETYLIPFFGQRYLTSITNKEVAEFEIWRNERIGRKLKSSTLLTFASAFSRIQQTAIAQGWISDKTPIPKLNVKGERGQARPAFTQNEITQLRQQLATWHVGTTGKTWEMRMMLRDLLDILIYTGMRAGTESSNICWQHIEWHTDKGVRYLRLWVSGKTGGRWLIAKHECLEVLKRIHQRQQIVSHVPFEQMIGSKLPLKLFRFSDGKMPYEMNKLFRKLLEELDLVRGNTQGDRTLYSLRHTYATNELLAGTDIHTLAKQMGTSVLMLERHYSKMTATMAAEKLA